MEEDKRRSPDEVADSEVWARAGATTAEEIFVGEDRREYTLKNVPDLSDALYLKRLSQLILHHLVRPHHTPAYSQ
jgi:hypothetical protein